MKVSKWTLLILVTICSICPAAAQQTSASNATVTKRLESAVLRAQAKAAAQQPVKHCVWCGRVETEEAALTPCPADPDAHCYFVAEPSVEPIQTKSSSDKAAKSSPLSNTPISSKHCVRCGRVETEEAALTPCPADPDVHCYFVAEPSVEPIQTKSSSDKAAKSSPLSNTPISSKHCVRCGRVETEEATLTPCPADPDVRCYFVSQETETTQK